MRNLEYALVLCLLIPTTVVADRWGRMGNRIYNYDKGTNYFRSGNRMIGSDGTVITRIQKGVFRKDGVIYRRNGNLFFGSDGSQWHKMGDTWYSNDGRKCRPTQPLADCDAL